MADEEPLAINDFCIGDSVLVLKSGNSIFSYSLPHGTLISRISRHGRASYEYGNVWDFGFLPGGSIYLYDIDLKKVLVFSCDGDALNKVEVNDSSSSRPFQAIIPYNEGYIGKRVYGMPGTPELSFYDGLFRYKNQIGKKEISSGIKLWRQFFRNEGGGVLYCPYFRNEILSVTDTSVSPKYSVSFGKHTFTWSSRYKDEYDCIAALNAKDGRYASCISNLYEDDRVLSFRFVYNSCNYVVIYNKLDKSVITYRFISESTPIQQVCYYKGKIYVILALEDGSCRLCTLSGSNPV